MIVVANAELAQSYMHQALMIFLYVLSFTFVLLGMGRGEASPMGIALLGFAGVEPSGGFLAKSYISSSINRLKPRLLS